VARNSGVDSLNLLVEPEVEPLDDQDKPPAKSPSSRSSKPAPARRTDAVPSR